MISNPPPYYSYSYSLNLTVRKNYLEAFLRKADEFKDFFSEIRVTKK